MNTTLEQSGPPDLAQQHAGTYGGPETPARGLLRAATLQLAILAIAVIGLAFVLIKFSHLFESLGAWGYLGVAAAEFGNSAMLIFPTPVSAYTFAMGAVLNPFAVGIIGGVAATLGDLVGYFLGRKGSAILPNHPLVARMQVWTERWGGIILFGFAALPVPFDIAGIWAGTVRYPLIRFTPIVLVGKTVKVTTISLAGYFGLETLLQMFS